MTAQSTALTTMQLLTFTQVRKEFTKETNSFEYQTFFDLITKNQMLHKTLFEHRRDPKQPVC